MWITKSRYPHTHDLTTGNPRGVSPTGADALRLPKFLKNSLTLKTTFLVEGRVKGQTGSRSGFFGGFMPKKRTGEDLSVATLDADWNDNML